MDKKALQAALLILGAFILGLVTGVGGAVWLTARGDLGRRPEHMHPPPPRQPEPPPVDEDAAFLPGLAPEKRERIESLIDETRESARVKAREIRTALATQTDTFFAELRIAAPDADVEEFASLAREALAGSRRGIPPPPHAREEFTAWLDRQEIPESQRTGAMDALDRYMEHYWEAFRSLMELSAQKRREVRETIGGELTDEQRRALRERLRDRRREGPDDRFDERRGPPPPHHRPPPPPPPPPHR